MLVDHGRIVDELVGCVVLGELDTVLTCQIHAPAMKAA